MNNSQQITDIRIYQRFIDDFKIPVSTINLLYWNNILNDYSDEMVYWWNTVSDVIQNLYNGDTDTFLSIYYNLRECIINAVKENSYYIHTITNHNYKDSQVSPCIELQNSKHKELYKETNINKRFISIDIKDANFNALRYIEPKIFDGNIYYSSWINIVIERYFNAYCINNDNIETRDDLIMFWNQYFLKSKYTRQVIFGQLNPKLCISTEKQIITRIGNAFFEIIPDDLKCDICVNVINADEIVLEIPDDDIISTNIQNYIKMAIINVFYLDKDGQFIRNYVGTEIIDDIFKIIDFKLSGYLVNNDTTNKNLFVFYKKSTSNKLYNLNKRYYLMIKCILENKSIPDYLKEYNIDGMTFELKDKLSIKQI